MAQGFKTGGREPGIPNKITGKVREMISQFVESKFEQVMQNFNTLTPQEQWKIMRDLLPFVVPKMQNLSSEIKFENLSDEDLEKLISELKPKPD